MYSSALDIQKKFKRWDLLHMQTNLFSFYLGLNKVQVTIQVCTEMVKIIAR